jgi:hypothetical protein
VFYYANTQTNLLENGMKKCCFMRDARVSMAVPCVPFRSYCTCDSSMHSRVIFPLPLSRPIAKLRRCMEFFPMDQALPLLQINIFARVDMGLSAAEACL